MRSLSNRTLPGILNKRSDKIGRLTKRPKRLDVAKVKMKVITCKTNIGILVSHDCRRGIAVALAKMIKMMLGNKNRAASLGSPTKEPTRKIEREPMLMNAYPPDRSACGRCIDTMGRPL
jgi:hypothetical protein